MPLTDKLKTAANAALDFAGERLAWARENWKLLVGIGVLIAALFTPWHVTVTGEFKVISLTAPEVRTLTDGIVSEIRVKAGAQVKKDEIVARLLDTDLRMEVMRVEAELAGAEARLLLLQNGFRPEEVQFARLRVGEAEADTQFARATVQRESQLLRDGLISSQQMEESKTRLALKEKALAQAQQELRIKLSGSRIEEQQQAKARVEAMRAQVAHLKQQLTWTEVRAPADGVVVTPDYLLQAQLGKFLKRGDELLRIVDPASLVARIELPEREVGDVAVGQTVRLRSFQFPRDPIDARVDRMEQTVEQPSEFVTSVAVMSRIESNQDKLRLGSRGIAKIECRRETLAYLIYRRALKSLFVQIWSWW